MPHKNTTYTTIQQDQTLTPCTHAYDHITQHIDNLEDPMQQHTVYTNEVDASLFTMDTTTPCDYIISFDMPTLNNPQENKTNTIQPRGIHTKSKHKYRNVFSNSNIQYHDFDNGDALTFTDKYIAHYNKNYKILIGICMIPKQLKAIKYLLKWT